MKKIKLVSSCCIIILVIVFTCVIINTSKDSNSKVTYEETVSSEPESEYYSIVLPNGYSIKHSDEVKYEDYLYKGKERVATIDINPNSDYSLALSSIVTNWIGESAYIKNDVEEKNFDSYKRYQALISFEKSAAQEENGESLPDQLHYFYVKDNLLLDLSLDLNYIDEKSAMLIANTIKLK